MFALLFSFFKKQSFAFKLLSVITVVLFFTATGYAVKYSFSQYKLVRFQKEKINQLEGALNTSEEKTKQTILVGKKQTKKVKILKNEIDKKLIQDEKTIDNDTISDADILSFIANIKKR